MRHLTSSIIWFTVICLWCIGMMPTAVHADGREFIITSTADSGNGTLRQAILDINRLSERQPATIRFQMDAPRPHVIALQSALPEITAPVTIDGGAECATDDRPSQMRVVIDGAAVPSGDGLLLDRGASNSTISGLSIVNFAKGAGIFINGADDVTITCNHIGVDATGTRAGANDVGISAVNASIITIGSDFMGARNVISGNLRYGVWLNSPANVVANYIGTDATGTQPIPNGLSGIYIKATDTSVTGNLISGNNEMGVLIIDSQTITIAGNYIGTDASGAQPLPNRFSGVYVRDSTSITIAGGNTISGNGELGIVINACNAVTIQSNVIGVDPSGTTAVPNKYSGISLMQGTSDVVIGGEMWVTGNLISGNGEIGIRIADANTRDVRIAGNLIGTDASGRQAIPNGLSGIYLLNGTSNITIGTGTYEGRNLISGNGQSGIALRNSANNVITGNYIGTDITGSFPLPNGYSGISLEGGARNNRIGGNAQGAGNLISGNAELGVYLTDAGTTNNRIVGNFIGTDITGTYAIGNGLSGVGIFGGVTNTQVGGVGEYERNLISGNGQFGVAVVGIETRGVTIENNLIGTDWEGKTALANGYGGVIVEDGAQDVRIGGDTLESRNLISGNAYSGIAVRDSGSGGVVILGNFIGSDITGQQALPNAVNGIRINQQAVDVRIGSAQRGAGNLIAFNGSHGVYVDGVTEIAIAGNAIISNNGAGIFMTAGTATAVTLGDNDFKDNCQNPPSDMRSCQDVVGR